MLLGAVPLKCGRAARSLVVSSSGPVGSRRPELATLTRAISHIQHRHDISHAPRSRVVFLGVVVSSPLDGSALTPGAGDTRRPVMVAPRIADEVGDLIQRAFAAYVASFMLTSFQGALACDDIALEAVYLALTTRLGIIHPWASSRTLLVTQLWCGAERGRGGIR